MFFLPPVRFAYHVIFIFGLTSELEWFFRAVSWIWIQLRFFLYPIFVTRDNGRAQSNQVTRISELSMQLGFKGHREFTGGGPGSSFWNSSAIKNLKAKILQIWFKLFFNFRSFPPVFLSKNTSVTTNHSSGVMVKVTSSNVQVVSSVNRRWRKV